MLTPRLLLILALAGLPGLARAGTEVAPVPPDLPVAVPSRPSKLGPLLGPDEEPAVAVSAPVREALKKVFWRVKGDGGLERVEGADKGFIPPLYLTMAGLSWRNGELIFSGTPSPVSHEMFAPMLKGLSTFVSAATVERAKAGSALAAWGFPPSVDGRRLYNPGGDATYYGIMLHYFFAPKPDLVAKLGVERTSQALDLLGLAHYHAFRKQAPDVAQVTLDRVRAILFTSARGGETPLGSPALKALPDPAAMLKDYKTQLMAEAEAALKAGDDVRRKDSIEALMVLNTLEKQRMNRSLDLAVVPEPGKAPAYEPEGPEPAGYVPLASGLPGVLRVLERINGKPLTSDQQENLIRSFPMGDLVWRMGAQNLWRQGLTGKGVKVAVIDEGIAENQELDAAVKGRVNLTSQRGEGSVGAHGTHVAGIIHALAPDAELRGYAALASDGSNPMLREFSDEPIINAIHRAVKDGNQVINMSLGSAAGPSADMARVVEQYASKGVIFLIATGNSRAGDGGVGAPSSAPSAISVGSLDAAGRMADSSTYGARFDARKLTNVVKDIFMAPGVNIVSTMPTPQYGDRKSAPTYAAMSGTSMATPAMSGISALLVQEMGNMTLVPNPIEAAQRLKAALVQGSTQIELGNLPPNVPLDQPFYVVQPLKALEALRASNVPVAGK